MPLLKKNKISQSLLSFIISFGLFSTIAFKVYFDRQEMHELEQKTILNSYSSDVEKAILNALQGPYLVRAAMRDYSYTQEQFETLAKQILNHSDGSQTIQLAPNGIIAYSYPLLSHESVINADLFKNKTIQDSLQKTIQTKQMQLDGPKELSQGGQGLVARLPIFKQDTLWGFSIAVLRFPEFISNIKPKLASASHRFEVWQKQDTNYRPLLANQTFDESEWLTQPIMIKNQQWVVGIKDQFILRSHTERERVIYQPKPKCFLTQIRQNKRSTLSVTASTVFIKMPF